MEDNAIETTDNNGVTEESFSSAFASLHSTTETPTATTDVDTVNADNSNAGGTNTEDKPNGAADDKVDSKDGSKVKDGEDSKPSKSKQNSINAQRRIAAKKARRARMESIRKEHEGLKNSDIANDPSVQMRMRNLEDRYGDLQAEEKDEVYNNFTDKVYDDYGDDVESANKALDAIDRCADYINDHEPILRKMMGRKGGLKVLGTWATIMTSNPAMRKSWFGKLDSEKERIILGMFNKLNNKGNTVVSPAPATAPAAAPKVQVANAPIANSGSQSGSNAPTDDFGIAWNKVRNERRSKI